MAKSNKVLAGLIAGVLVGAAAGVLLAPKPGRDLRESVGGRTAVVANRAGRAVKRLDSVRTRFKRDRPGQEIPGEAVYNGSVNGV
jgi:gas vesicle protein